MTNIHLCSQKLERDKKLYRIIQQGSYALRGR